MRPVAHILHPHFSPTSDWTRDDSICTTKLTKLMIVLFCIISLHLQAFSMHTKARYLFWFFFFFEERPFQFDYLSNFLAQTLRGGLCITGVLHSSRIKSLVIKRQFLFVIFSWKIFFSSRWNDDLQRI